jgi:hypothetical protein
MDLIDKKLSEKLKLFEYIDKKYGTDIDSSEKAPPKKSELNQNRNFIQNTFLQKEARSKKEIYDNIYSDFKTNTFKDYYQSPSINTLDSKKTKYQSKFQKIKRKNLRNNKEDKDSLEINRTAENTIRTKSTTKNLKGLYPPNDSGNRLYNYGYYIKNKLNKKRQKEEEKMRKQMTPKILNRSKEMIRDKDRDPNKFEERLYYAEKNDTNDSIYNRKRTLSRENINYEKYNSTKFTYHPKINKKSLLIASKLEPSTLRITRKKSNKSHILEEKNVLDYYSNLFKDKTYTNKKKPNLSPSCGNEKSNELYMRGMQDMKRKEKTYNENLLKKKEEYKNYSYHPKISKTYSNNFGNKGKKNKNMEDIYTKNKEWKKRLEKENNTKKKKYDEIENKKYTFKPEINKLNMENDVPFIMKNIQQMNDYVNKRRKILKKQKEEENYKKRKLGLDANNYNVKTTIPKKFELKTEQRCKSNKKERDINLLNKNIKKKDEFYNNALIMANKNVKIKNNKGFSVLNMGDMEECKNNYWNDNNYNYNYSNNKGTKIGTSMTQSQQDFLNAVNDLHITIEKLNI